MGQSLEGHLMPVQNFFLFLFLRQRLGERVHMLARMIQSKKKTPCCRGGGILVRKAPEKVRGGQVHRACGDVDLGHSLYPLWQERACGGNRT